MISIDNFLEVNNLSVELDGDLLVNNISFNIKEGELLCLLGHSGSGKSMIINAISGFIKIKSGTILVDDIDITNVSIQDRNVMIVDQDILLFDHMNIYENIAFGLKMQKISNDIIDYKVNDVAKSLDIESLLYKKTTEISGGEQQRVAIARALASNPKVLLLDEPFSKLDIRLRESLQNLVKKIQAEYHITMLLVTHDKDEAMLLSDNILLIKDGNHIEYGTPEKIFRNPHKIDTFLFFGNANVIKVDESNQCTLSKLIKLNVTKGYVVIEHSSIVVGNDYEGQITDIKYFGNDYLYTISFDGIELQTRQINRYMINNKIKFCINKFVLKDE